MGNPKTEHEKRRRQRRRAERLGIAGREIPEGHGVLHHCDVRPCTNYESHLFTGTQADNIHDMIAKGRGIVGEKNPRATLDVARARIIRALLAEGRLSLAAIGRAVGVSTWVVWSIKDGRKHVA